MSVKKSRMSLNQTVPVVPADILNAVDGAGLSAAAHQSTITTEPE